MSSRITGLTITSDQIKINYSNSRYYAKGVNWWPSDYGSKVMNMYSCSYHQGAACSKADVNKIIKSGVNSLAFITNLEVWDDPSTWTLGANSVQNPSLQTQTDISHNVTELEQLHSKGICMRIVLGSWCSRFPTYWNLHQKGTLDKWLNSGITISGIDDSKLQDPNNFKAGANKFVERFKVINSKSNNTFDGIDFDWEGYCQGPALWNESTCAWGPSCSGTGLDKDGNPQKLKSGKGYCKDTYATSGSVAPFEGLNYCISDTAKPELCKAELKECYTMNDQTTISIMIAISRAMREAGYVVTAAPTSTQLLSDIPDNSLDNGQNQYVRYDKGKLLPKYLDGVMLQWYSGFDAGMCSTEPSSYPRIAGIKAGRCNINNVSIMKGYSKYMHKTPANCPREIDCPDWQYSDSEPYAEQISIIKAMKNIGYNIQSQLVIGFEFYHQHGQWGPQPLPLQWEGLNKACKSQLGSDLAGYGGWTISGSLEDQKLNYDQDGNPGYDTTKANLPFKSYIHFREELNTCWGPWGTYKGSLTVPKPGCKNLTDDFYLNYFQKSIKSLHEAIQAENDLRPGTLVKPTYIQSDIDALQWLQQSRCGYKGSPPPPREPCTRNDTTIGDTCGDTALTCTDGSDMNWIGTPATIRCCPKGTCPV